jgi:hypothetical protein
MVAVITGLPRKVASYLVEGLPIPSFLWSAKDVSNKSI